MIGDPSVLRVMTDSLMSPDCELGSTDLTHTLSPVVESMNVILSVREAAWRKGEEDAGSSEVSSSSPTSSSETTNR